MAQLFSVHPVDPQVRSLRQAAQILDHGGVGAIPTDSCYALACHLDDKAAVDRVRQIRRIDERHLLTLMCRDLSDIALYAKVDNRQYRLLKNATPGPTPSFWKRRGKCRAGFRTPRARRSACGCPIIGSPRACSTCSASPC